MIGRRLGLALNLRDNRKAVPPGPELCAGSPLHPPRSHRLSPRASSRAGVPHNRDGLLARHRAIGGSGRPVPAAEPVDPAHGARAAGGVRHRPRALPATRAALEKRAPQSSPSRTGTRRARRRHGLFPSRPDGSVRKRCGSRTWSGRRREWLRGCRPSREREVRDSGARGPRAPTPTAPVVAPSDRATHPHRPRLPRPRSRHRPRRRPAQEERQCIIRCERLDLSRHSDLAGPVLVPHPLCGLPFTRLLLLHKT